MAKQGIITTTQNAITDVAKTGVQGARSIAGSAIDTASGTVLQAVRRARKMVGAPKKRRKTAKRRSSKAVGRSGGARKAARRKVTARKKVRGAARRKKK